VTRAIAFVDLDDSLFQTWGKCEFKEGLAVAAVGRDGKPRSYMTPGQGWLLGTLLAQADVIPATARNRESLGRVRIDFRHGAIMDFGGAITGPGDRLDEEWLARMGEEAKRLGPVLEEALAMAGRLIKSQKLSSSARVIEDFGVPFYLSAKTRNRDLSELAFLAKELKTQNYPDCGVFLNGNNLVLKPNYLDKGFAVERFLDKHVPGDRKDAFVLGIGDSLTDSGFLRACDYKIVPGGSQLGRRI
jgi:hypothetical protein